MCKSQQSNLSAENNPTMEGKFSCIYLIKKDVKLIREFTESRRSDKINNRRNGNTAFSTSYQ
jgi:hypothetical protein